MYEVTDKSKELFGNEILKYRINFDINPIDIENIAFYVVGKTNSNQSELLSLNVFKKQVTNISIDFWFDIANYKKIFIVALNDFDDSELNLDYSNLTIKMIS